MNVVNVLFLIWNGTYFSVNVVNVLFLIWNEACSSVCVVNMLFLSGIGPALQCMLLTSDLE